MSKTTLTLSTCAALASIALVGCEQQRSGSVIGTVAQNQRPLIQSVRAVSSDRGEWEASIDDRGHFELAVVEGDLLRLFVDGPAIQLPIHFGQDDSGVEIETLEVELPHEDHPIDLGLISLAPDHSMALSENDPNDPLGEVETEHGTEQENESESHDSSGSSCQEASVEDCQFSTYNLDVQVGDRFVLSRFVGCDALPGVDYTFVYEGNTNWNLDAFNADLPVEIAEQDLTGGNHGDGEYRLFLIDAGTSEEIDHMTIRIGHGDESDIRAGDDVVPLRSSSSQSGDCVRSSDSGSGSEGCASSSDCSAGFFCDENATCQAAL